MSRQTNLRTMEERIYQLEKNGGGGTGGDVKWSDVKYKPFKTLDSNDFVVESDKLKLKNGGSTLLPIVKQTSGTNDTEFIPHSKDIHVICGVTWGGQTKVKGCVKLDITDTVTLDNIETFDGSAISEALEYDLYDVSDSLVIAISGGDSHEIGITFTYPHEGTTQSITTYLARNIILEGYLPTMYIHTNDGLVFVAIY